MEDAVLISFKEFPIPFKRSTHFANLDENSSKIRKIHFHALLLLLLLKDPSVHRMIRKRLKWWLGVCHQKEKSF